MFALNLGSPVFLLIFVSRIFKLWLNREYYINEKILGVASMDDAYHIAIATVNRIDVLLSWNFKHIVNWDKIRLFNAINMKNGYPSIDIRSPKELLKYED